MNDGFGPFEWRRGLVVGSDDPVDGVVQLPRRAEAHASEGLLGEDTEPTLHLVQPRRRCWDEVQVDSRVAFQPAVVFLGVRVQKMNWLRSANAICRIERSCSPRRCKCAAGWRVAES